MKKLINCFVVILFLLILFLGYCFVSLYVIHSPYINLFGYTCFEVRSGSMSPVIQTNDVVLVKIHDKYHVDDIVTFLYDGDYITHRVVQIQGDTIITKGDANNVYDVSVSSSVVVGRVVSIWKNVGIWQRVLFAPRVLSMFIITLFLFVLTYSYDSNLYRKFRMRRISKRKIKNIKREIKEGKKKVKKAFAKNNKTKSSVKRG